MRAAFRVRWLDGVAMRLASRKDERQAVIFSELREMGFAVADTSNVGNGFGDAVISKHYVNAILEIKTPKGLKTALQRLRPSQIEFHANWKGPIITAYTASEVSFEFNLLLKRRQGWAISDNT